MAARSGPTTAVLTPRRRRFVLVTGMPRSGTTGVGAALAHAPGAASLYEPLNPESGLRSVPDYFVLPPAGPLADDTRLARQLSQVLRVSVRTRTGVWPQDPPWRRLVKQVTGSTSRASAVRIRLDPRVRTVVWKDPFAALLVPSVTAELGISSVITVRPPEASAASFKRLGWDFDVARIARGLQTIHPGADYLEGMVEEARAHRDPTAVGAQLWRLVYGFLHHALVERGATDGTADSVWVNSRLLLADPRGTYVELYRRMGLEMTRDAERAIDRDYRDEGSGSPAGGVTHDAGRNVQKANSYWADVLDRDELEMVRALTDGVRAELETHMGGLS